jgi:N-acetylmuramoyl-L-alanine amidase
MMKKWIFLSVTLFFSSAIHAELNGFSVGIDPGHGGTDVGAVANGLRESDLNLTTALSLRDFLQADGAEVVMSRSTNVSRTAEGSGQVELSARANFFNTQGVDYTISVHHNSASPSANGVLAYIARGLCAGRSGSLAFSVVQNIRENNGLPAMQGGQSTSEACPDKAGVFQYGAVIVKETSMPAILSEVSFLTNVTEAERLRNFDYVRSNGWAIYSGFVDFIGGGRSALPFAEIVDDPVVEERLAPTLLAPQNGSQNNSAGTILFQWNSNNDVMDISDMSFSLEQVPDYQIDNSENYVGQCNNLTISPTDQYSSDECGSLDFAQWYKWTVRLYFADGSEKESSAYFQTEVQIVEETFDCSTVTNLSQSECETLVALYDNTKGESWFTDAEISTTECQTLTTRYDGIHGANWESSLGNNWARIDDPCQWTGVTCGSGHVIDLNLTGKNLSGVLPDLSGLNRLQFLNLAYNQLEDTLPNSSKLPLTLQVLNLSHNQFSGEIPDLSGLSNLTVLQLQNNQLCGTVPSTVSDLTGLQVLNLANNHLVATDSTVLAFLNSRDSHWADTQTNTCTSSGALPYLSNGIVETNFSATTTTLFHGGTSVNSGTFLKTATMTTMDHVDIYGKFTTDSAHIGQVADIIVVAGYQLPPSYDDSTTYYYMINTQGGILAWDEDFTSLVPFRKEITLGDVHSLPMYQGLLGAGSLKIYLKYRLQNGTIISNATPIEIVITELP